MGYIEQHLLPGERVIYKSKIHWVIFLEPAIFMVIFLLAFFANSSLIAGLFFWLTILVGIVSFITYSSSEFGVTNKRVLIKTGFIRRHSIETLLTKVEGIIIDQSILGRIFGYGTIVINGVGGTKERFQTIDKPFEFRKIVQGEIMALQSEGQGALIPGHIGPSSTQRPMTFD